MTASAPLWQLAVDTALELDLTSVPYPVWQAAVAVRLAVALRP
jgi:hypothetical protein